MKPRPKAQTIDSMEFDSGEKEIWGRSAVATAFDKIGLVQIHIQ